MYAMRETPAPGDVVAHREFDGLAKVVTLEPTRKRYVIIQSLRTGRTCAAHVDELGVFATKANDPSQSNYGAW
jgi:hypothetical protein